MVKRKYANHYYSELDFYEVKKILKSLPRYSLVTFAGGEPFMREDIMDILKYSVGLNKLSIITNGTLITEGIAKSLVEIGSKSFLHRGLIAIDISLEGLEKMHDNITGLKGSYTKTIENIKMILRYKKIKKKTFPLINLRFTIINDNVGVLSKFLLLAEELNVDICNFSIATIYRYFDNVFFMNRPIIEDHIKVYSSINLKILEKQLDKINSMRRKVKLQIRFTPSSMPISEMIKYYRKELDLSNYTCYSPWSKLLILPNGEVSLCFNHKVTNLNLRDFEINELWNTKLFKTFRRALKKNKIFKFCEGCCQIEFKKK
jgi:MoaA/NifB/PqqE/SkfB family radical SAM enzyme